MLALEDAGYSVLFHRELILTYPKGVDPVLMDHRIDREYVVLGQPTTGSSGWITESSSVSEMDGEQDAPNIDEVPKNESSYQIYERDAHTNTG